MRFTLLDYCILLIAAALTVAAAIFIYSGGGADSVVIEATDASGKKTEWEYSLHSDKVVKVNGANGETEVQIKDGNVSVLASACKNKLCILQGGAHKAGAVIACLPNKVIVRVKGKDKNEVDAGLY